MLVMISVELRPHGWKRHIFEDSFAYSSYSSIDECLEKTLDSNTCVGVAIADLSITFDRLPHNRLVTDYLSLWDLMQRNCHNACLLM